MTLAAVRAGLKAVLDPIAGLTVYGYVPLGILTPAAVIAFPADPYDPHAVLGPGTDYRIDVYLFVGLADDNIADITLGTFSDLIVAAIDATPTLGGACDSADVVAVGDFVQAPIYDGGPVALQCVHTVEVFT